MTGVPTMYERVGGDAFFDALTGRFYSAVRQDPVLRPLYPEDDEGFEQARRHLRDFLVQYWGGPDTYNQTRGAPRLRQRHVPFAIGAPERDAWLTHMTEAVRAAKLHPLDEAQMIGYFNAAAATLTNQP
jgi:hemoglobin